MKRRRSMCGATRMSASRSSHFGSCRLACDVTSQLKNSSSRLSGARILMTCSYFCPIFESTEHCLAAMGLMMKREKSSTSSSSAVTQRPSDSDVSCSLWYSAVSPMASLPHLIKIFKVQLKRCRQSDVFPPLVIRRAAFPAFASLGSSFTCDAAILRPSLWSSFCVASA